jgi:hypothetical protein
MMPNRQLYTGHVPPSAANNSAAAVSALTHALQTEAKLLHDLCDVLDRQRIAVAESDIEAVDDSVFVTHRLLLSLGEARKRRRTINHILGEGDDLSIPALEDYFGGNVPDEVREAAEQLADSARMLQRDVAINRRVLRSAIDTGDEQVRALCGAPTTRSVSYSPQVRPNGLASVNSSILDRRA